MYAYCPLLARATREPLLRLSASEMRLPVAISLFSGQIARQEPFGEIMAAAVIVTVPLIIMVLIFQKRKDVV